MARRRRPQHSAVQMPPASPLLLLLVLLLALAVPAPAGAIGWPFGWGSGRGGDQQQQGVSSASVDACEAALLVGTAGEGRGDKAAAAAAAAAEEWVLSPPKMATFQARRKHTADVEGAWSATSSSLALCLWARQTIGHGCSWAVPGDDWLGMGPLWSLSLSLTRV